MCRFFQTSRSGYYDFVHRMGRPENDTALAEIIAEQRERSFRTYGYRRMWLVLEQRGIHRNPKAILYIYFYNHEYIQLKTGVAPLTLRHSA